MIRSSVIGHLKFDSQQLVFFDTDVLDFKEWLKLIFNTPTTNHYVIYGVNPTGLVPPWITIMLEERDMKNVNTYLRSPQKVKGLCLSGQYPINLTPEVMAAIDWVIVGIGAETEKIIKICEENNKYVYCPDFGYMEYPEAYHGLTNLNELVIIQTSEREIRALPCEIRNVFTGPLRLTEWHIRAYDMDLKKVVLIPLFEIQGIKPCKGWIPRNKTSFKLLIN